MKQTFYYFLPTALMITVLMFVVFGVFQKVVRSSGDDPQVQMAEDAARLLENGLDPAVLVSTNNLTVDIATSLSPFLVVYDHGMNVVVSGARYRNGMPKIPAEVLAYVRQNGEQRFTWQPDQATQIATVVVPYGGDAPGFVVAGRSMREIVGRTYEVQVYLFGIWIAALVICWLSSWISARRISFSMKKIIEEEMGKRVV